VPSYERACTAVEIGTKLFAVRPVRFWRSSCNRVDLLLVLVAIAAQVTTIIHVLEQKALWRACTALPMMRIFTLVHW
jgi:hypothetical protein